MIPAILNKNKGFAPAAFIIIIAILLLSVIVGKSVAETPQFALILILALAIGLITIVNTDMALIILIFSMLFSPELKFGEVAGRGVVLRIDDILLFVVFLTWIVKMAVNKQLGLLRHTPLNGPMIAFIAVCIVSTALGVSTGTPDIASPLKATFYIVKYLEYFMLFFMVVNNLRDKKQIKILMIAFFITCFLVCIYGYAQIPVKTRISAPFEGEYGEPNTLGGYLLLLFAVSFGISLYTSNPPWRFWMTALSCFIIPPFLFSLSRGSYLGFIVMYLAMIILTTKKRTLLIIILLVAIPIVPITLPVRVVNRIAETFQPGKVYEPFGRKITLDESASVRITTLQRVFEKWQSRPLLGYGVTGIGIVDSQVSRVLGETGFIGSWIYMWLMLTIFRIALYSLKTLDDDWARGLSFGFLTGFIGLLIHAFSASTFIIVRIMEPFWFLMAIIIMLPEIYVSPEQQAQAQQV